METGNTYGTVNSSTQDDAILVSVCNILGNNVSFGIIKSTIKSPRSAVEISRENCVPLSSVYRQIRRLRKAGIIQVESELLNNRNNKRIAYYRCRLRLVRMSVDENETKIFLKSYAQLLDVLGESCRLKVFMDASQSSPAW